MAKNKGALKKVREKVMGKKIQAESHKCRAKVPDVVEENISELLKTKHCSSCS